MNDLIAERDGAILRALRDEDWPCVDAITILCHAPIQASYEEMLGPECYAAVGFDRAVPIVEYWQDLTRFNAGSVPT